VFDRRHFVVSASNQDAVRAIDRWPDWPGGCLTVIGPEGVGKSHLARAWAAGVGAAVLTPKDTGAPLPPQGPVLLEDADRWSSEADLFHLINRAAEGHGLLMTARTPPRQWAASLPDLRSRLNALMWTEIGPPDDTVLEGVLRKLFRDRNIRVEREVLAYLVRRIERSAPAAVDVVRRLDEAADAAGRGVTRSLAREVLGVGDETLDLFE
jgi:chromosomal replication initiation ATPase DnaA